MELPNGELQENIKNYLKEKYPTQNSDDFNIKKNEIDGMTNKNYQIIYYDKNEPNKIYEVLYRKYGDILDLSDHDKEIYIINYLANKKEGPKVLYASSHYRIVEYIKDYSIIPLELRYDKKVLNDIINILCNYTFISNIYKYSLNPEIKIALLDGSIRRKTLLPDLPGRDELFSKIFNYGEENFMLPFTNNYEESCAVIEKEVSDPAVAKILKDEVKTALSGGYYNDNLLETAVKMNATSVNLWYNTVTKEFIAKAHSKGLKVFVYTVNEEEDLRRLPELGVDGFFTDYWANSVAFMTKEGLL